MNSIIKALLLGLCLISIGCTTTPPERTKLTDLKAKTPVAESKKVSEPAKPKEKALNLEDYDIDYDGLQRYLKLQRRPSKLGFESKTFESCKAGYGLPKSEFCQTLHYSVIHFRLQCRDSQGTTSTIQTHTNTQDISHQNLKWTLENSKGDIRTDGEGFGQVQAITAKPAARQHLRISNGDDFLFVRAGEISRIVTPSDWCNY